MNEFCYAMQGERRFFAGEGLFEKSPSPAPPSQKLSKGGKERLFICARTHHLMSFLYQIFSQTHRLIASFFHFITISHSFPESS